MVGSFGNYGSRAGSISSWVGGSGPGTFVGGSTGGTRIPPGTSSPTPLPGSTGTSTTPGGTSLSYTPRGSGGFVPSPYTGDALAAPAHWSAGEVQLQSSGAAPGGYPPPGTMRPSSGGGAGDMAKLLIGGALVLAIGGAIGAFVMRRRSS
jgi:hypothetical protein